MIKMYLLFGFLSISLAAAEINQNITHFVVLDIIAEVSKAAEASKKREYRHKFYAALKNFDTFYRQKENMETLVGGTGYLCDGASFKLPLDIFPDTEEPHKRYLTYFALPNGHRWVQSKEHKVLTDDFWNVDIIWTDFHIQASKGIVKEKDLAKKNIQIFKIQRNGVLVEAFVYCAAGFWSEGLKFIDQTKASALQPFPQPAKTPNVTFVTNIHVYIFPSMLMPFQTVTPVLPTWDLTFDPVLSAANPITQKDLLELFDVQDLGDLMELGE